MPVSHVENIDCMRRMRDYPDKYFDLAIPDPPYGIGAGTMNFVSRPNLYVKQKTGKKIYLPKKNYAPKAWDNVPPTQEYFDEVCRISKHQIIWGINYFDWTGVGPGRIIWDKCVADGVGFSRYEYAYCSMIDTKVTVTLLHSGMMQARSLKEPTTPHGNKAKNEKRVHACQKPKLLYQWIFEQFAEPGFKILDTHMGSGNSRIIAYKMGFDFTGFEIDPEYFEIARNRFWQETAMPLFDLH